MCANIYVGWSPRGGNAAELLENYCTMSHGRTHINSDMKGTVLLLPTPCGMSSNLFYLCQIFENAVSFLFLFTFPNSW